jgi:eukaryotic-like serine/threonine-protein kinase
MVTLSEFLDLLGRLHLLEPAQLDELRRQSQGPSAEPRAVARGLIDRGGLTPFQANHLLQGRANELLLGHYVLQERLGEGGMGQVFKAWDPKLGRAVALKVIRKERLANRDAVKRFVRELRAAAQLDHPHIVRALDADEVAGTHLLVMEFVPGTALSCLVGRRGPLPVRAACEFLRQAALGLQHASEKGLVHRDVKPSNLLLTLPPGVDATTADEPALTAGRVKILDFGLARLGHPEGEESTTALTREGVLMGTVDYLAPEQALDSHAVDIRADLYSLGCTGYYLLAGRVPFPGGSSVSKVMRHRLDEPTPLEQLRPEVPTVVAAVVRKLMAKPPDQRFRTPAKAAAVLQSVLLGEPVTIVVGWPAAPDRTLPDPPDNPFAGLETGDTTVGASTTPPERRPAPAPRRLRPLLAAVVVCAVLVTSLALGLRWLLSPGQPHPAATEPRTKTGRTLSPQEQAAEDAFQPLTAKWEAGIDQPAERDAFRKDLLEFRMKHPGTPAALRAAELVTKLPSPLDRLDPEGIPPEERADGQPRELVAVLGETRGRQWWPVTSIAWSPDGKLLASSDAQSTISLWDAATLRLKGRLEWGHSVYSLAFSPDGKTLASGGYPRHPQVCVGLWDVATGKLLRGYDGKQGVPVTAVAFSPDGQRLLAGYEKSLVVWDVESGQEVRRWEGHDSGSQGVGFADDGMTVVSRGADGIVRVWDLGPVTPKQRTQMQIPQPWSVSVSPRDGTIATARASGRLSLWDVQGEEPRERILQEGGAAEVAFQPQGKVLACITTNNTLLLWDLGGPEPKVRSTLPVPVGRGMTPAFSPDGRTLACGSTDGTLRLWDVDTGKEEQPLASPTGAVTGLCFTPDCLELFAAHQQGTAVLWDLATRTPRGRFPGRVSPYSPQVAVSPDGKWLAAATYVADQTLNVWSRDTGELHLKPNRGNPALVPCFSPDGRYLAAACGASGTQVWNAEDGRLLFATPNTFNPTSCDFSPTGSVLAAGGSGGTVNLYDLPSGQQRKSIKVADGGIPSVRFHPDGGPFAAGGILFDPARSRAVFSATGVITGFSPDGKTLAAVTGNTLSLHETATGQLLREWHFPGPVHFAGFANDGRHLATANGNGTVYVLRLVHPDTGPPRAVGPDEAARLQQAEAQRLGVPVELANSLGMKLRLIPPGKFLMGSPPKETGHRDEEFQHEVVITQPYYLGMHEVTVGQFRVFVQDTGYRTEVEKSGAGAVRRVKNNTYAPDPGCTWREPGFEQTDDQPVVCVSWNDAVAFCVWLSRKEGKPYALPTEAEWEYACRAGSQTAYGFGDSAQGLAPYAWHDPNSDGKTHAVGGKKPNAWNLFDLHGNAWEWTADWYTGDSYRKGPKEDPTGPTSGTTRVLRGGSWNNQVNECRSAARLAREPAQGFDAVGFRVVLRR